MEANGMRARFLLGYEAARLANRTFNDREIEDFLNKAQLEFTKSRYDAWKNRAKIGYGQHETRNSELAGLLTSTIAVVRANFILGTNANGGLKGPDLDSSDQDADKYGVFVGIPDEVLYPILATCVTEKDLVTKENVEVEDKSLMEYKLQVFDPYKKPYDNLVWSLDWGAYTPASPNGNNTYDDSAKEYSEEGTGFNMEGLNYLGATTTINTIRAKYLIPGKGWKVTEYVIFYVKMPNDIHIDVQTPGLQQHCLMPRFVHQDIVDMAVKLASATIIPEQGKYQVNQLESKEDE